MEQGIGDYTPIRRELVRLRALWLPTDCETLDVLGEATSKGKRLTFEL